MNLRRTIRRGLLCFVYLFFGVASVNAASFNYGYDPLNRLTNAAYSDGSRESYSHDSAGNRLTRVTLASTAQSDTVAPSIPSGLIGEEVSLIELRLTWNRVFDTGGSGMGGYFIYTNGVLYATTTATTLILSGLLANTPYSITIAAYDRAANISDPSIPIELFHLAPPSLRNPGLTSGILGFTLHGAIGSNYVIEASSNLVNWESILTNIILTSNTFPISDPAAINHPQRFYRAVHSTNEPPELSELIVNGSFEIPIPEMAENGSVGLPPGDTRLPGWTISGMGGPVHCSTTGALAANGTNVLIFNVGDNLAGTWISQTFSTTPGITYSLNFSIRRQHGTSDYRLRLRTTVKSQTNELLQIDDSIPSPQFQWGPVRIDFAATTETTTVTFLDDTQDNRGTDLLLDNVSVRRVTP